MAKRKASEKTGGGQRVKVQSVRVVPLDTLTPHPGNVRLHPTRNLEDIKASLREFGQQRPLLTEADGRTVIVGNGALAAMRELGWTEAAVGTTDLEGPRALAYAIADNRTGETSAWDEAALAAQLRAFHEAGHAHLSAATGWTAEEVAAKFRVAPETGEWGAALGGLPEGERAPFQQMTFTLHDDQAEIVRHAIAAAKDAGDFGDTGNENSNGNALARIAEAYLAHG